jgi:hypothetical protein
VAVKPASEAAGDPGYFTKGDPVGGTPATVPGMDWCNMMQEEMIAILVAFGVTPDQAKADYGQIIDALLANFANISGNASQLFKAAAGVAANDVVVKGQAASEDDTGLVELANAAEIAAGLDNERAVTSAGLASFPKLLTDSGYITLPGGLIIQWGHVLSGVTEAFPIAFPSAVLHVSGIHYGALATSNIIVDNSVGPTLTQFLFKESAGGLITVKFFALGY